LLVIAKAPVPGRAKTRLCPPLDPVQAARVAATCLLDTIDEVSEVAAERRVLLFDGDADGWCPPGWDLVLQRGSALGERLANAFDDVAGPAVVIAMDTPQVAAASLAAAIAAVEHNGTAVIGLTEDGGYWLLGLPAARNPHAVFDGIPMSTAGTGAAQVQRLVGLGYQVIQLEVLRDIDGYEDLEPVAALVPRRRIAALVATLIDRPPLGRNP
jgi:rSAM/selenodomain-associated transferase 1